MNWKDSHRAAALEDRLEEGVVRCRLSPRNCVIKPGKLGFCGVRGNVEGRLVTFNYGKGVHATEETIETEAVNHWSPGERILSLGNVGCMLNCDYCHNWKTSQARHVSDSDVHEYTPEGVVATAKRHGIRTLSWTYNDPVVWHEFVIDTARLARAAGMRNVFKSAFFISPEAVDELLPVIDVFSISIKSMDPEYYRRLTKGWVEPVLEATRQVHRAGKHVEVSCLMVTDVSDDEKTARDIGEFVLDDLDPSVPLHFVRFHPDYKMTNTTRTPVDRLHRARATAKSMGVRHVYLGNVHDADATSTWCPSCDARLVTRFGLNAKVVGLDAKVVGLDARGHCTACGADADVKLFETTARSVVDAAALGEVRTFDWHGDIRSLHVQARNTGAQPATIYWRRRGDSGAVWTTLALGPGESHRWLLAMAAPGETGVELVFPQGVVSNLHEVFDRAHFPTVAIEEACAETDLVPLPVYRR